MSNPAVIITGGTAGIGLAVAQVLSREGWRVALASRQLEGHDAARDWIAADPTNRAYVATDTRDQARVDQMVAAVLERFGRIDGLVNGAANPSPIAGPIEELDLSPLLGDLDTKVVGYLRCAKAVVPVMKRQGAGSIVNIGGLTGRSSNTLSGLRNAAVSHFTKTLADELGPFGIRVNAVHPGIVETPHLRELFQSEAEARHCTPAQVEADFVAQIPLRRVIHPEELGRVIGFLLSPTPVPITGESIAVDAGYSRGIYL
ncbi:MULTISPECIES: SDR family NAD(P)-dependent oxidoreductase [unclassified Azospirillum]|uniref:SDR family NAD(P)-dependent oxidoreductase n=1 Tax=unclassified Azospirillum TaxID=2630922 RepID=UPI000B74F69D|nr:MULTISPECIES: SDR family oxidoreductase [unclassified Azospirillum]SNS66252.1 NAD(P)-dependent dehydrogenase, short-chain alcohol dehydrogenase family [Azospirillum sp. RU38E]SNS84499.1 NAD(P)-dependent dehydrogenase, short-chain alcohol dehydrogenase family [Azospirillum sp. RU37A]